MSVVGDLFSCFVMSLVCNFFLCALFPLDNQARRLVVLKEGVMLEH